VSTSAVRVDRLGMRYGAVVAADDLSLAVRRGTITAVLGPNGAGKTTAVEACTGRRRPQTGTVRVLGLDPVADRVALMPRIGVLTQSGGAWPAVRAGELLRYRAGLYAHPADLDALTGRLGINGFAGTRYRDLSGGQRQLIGLAAALIGRPELVFLDEPTAGMDPAVRHATWAVLSELRADGVTVVLTTHLLDEAERLADEVVVIDRGRVVAAAPLAELVGGRDAGSIVPTRLTVRTRIAVSDPAGLVAGVPGVRVLAVGPREYRIEAERVDPDLVAEVAQVLARAGVLVDHLVVGSGVRSLEDVFLELTESGEST